jgi:hypothetical protein
MATGTDVSESTSALLVKKGQLIGGLRFNVLMGVLGFLWTSGLYVDDWAHAHGKVDKTFFTPWHVPLYSMFALNAGCLVLALLSNHRKGVSWQEAIPSGYGLSLLGSLIFACAAPADLVWHTLFGFEVGIEPLLSPSHLALATGAILTITGPLRATLRRSIPAAEQGWKTLLPMLLSLSATLMGFLVFTQFGHPFSHLFTIVSPLANDTSKSFGATGILLQTGLLMGFLLFAVRRWRLPLGSLTLLFAVYVTLLSVVNDQYQLIPGVVVAGIVADALLRVLRPASSRTELRVFAFVVPTVLYLCFFLTLALTDTIHWSIHLWLGSCVMAGITGLMLSFLLAPPQGPAEEPARTSVR